MPVFATKWLPTYEMLVSVSEHSKAEARTHSCTVQTNMSLKCTSHSDAQSTDDLL